MPGVENVLVNESDGFKVTHMTADILQLTDLHLMADPNAVLREVCTRDSLIDVLQLAKDRSQSEGWHFDNVIITGDLTHDEQVESYAALRDLLGDWVPRCRLIPGNHDDRALIRQVFPELVPADGEFINFSVEAAGWRLIGLDSHVDGEVFGRIGETQLRWLRNELTACVTQPTILFVHHPQVPVKSAWLDQIGMQDADALLEVVRSFSQIRAISAGHVHQEFAVTLDGVEIVTTPSTGVQFRPREDELVCDTISPGFRIFRLAENDFETQVIRLPERNH
jgi:Icc protein